MEKILKFTLERETKGAVRYAEATPSGKPFDSKGSMDEQGVTIGTLYVRKAKLNGSIPMELEVIVRAKP